MSKIIGMILTYNCAELVAGTIRDLPQGIFDQVIIVDDASSDSILLVAEALGIPAYTHEHLGYGGNVKFGLRQALVLGADCVVEIHGDGQYDSAAVTAALEKVQHGSQFVMGSRFLHSGQARRDGMPLVRYLANIGLSAIARVVLGSSLTEFHNGFRVYTRELVEKVDLNTSSNDWLFGFEIIAQAHFAKLSITEVPVRCDYHREHTSISLTKSTKYALQMFGVLAIYVWARLGFKTKLFAQFLKYLLHS